MRVGQSTSLFLTLSLFFLAVWSITKVHDLTKKQRTGKEDKPVFPPGLLPLPPLNVSDEVWEESMPEALKQDLFKYIDSKTKFDFRKWRAGMCSCSTHHRPPAINYVYHEGVFWYPKNHLLRTRPSEQKKFSLERSVLETVGTHLHKKYGLLPPIRLLFYYSSVHPGALCKCDPTFPPILVLASRKGETGLVRRPTMYLNPSWAKKAQRLYQNRAGWGEKRDVACWRGKADMFPGGKDRLTALSLQEYWKKNKPDMAKHLDIGSISSLKQRIKEWHDHGQIDQNRYESYLKIPTVKEVPVEWFSQCKYNIHLPGHSQGGYSRALQSLLPQKTLVFFWENPFQEYYYDWLKEGEHYIEVSKKKLEKKLKWALTHDRDAERMADKSVEVFRNYLTWDSILTYWEWIILSLLRYGTSNPAGVTSEYCTCMTVNPLHQRCSFCDSLSSSSSSPSSRESKHSFLRNNKTSSLPQNKSFFPSLFEK